MIRAGCDQLLKFGDESQADQCEIRDLGHAPSNTVSAFERNSSKMNTIGCKIGDSNVLKYLIFRPGVTHHIGTARAFPFQEGSLLRVCRATTFDC